MSATVLVAEDSLVVRAVLRQHLESQGYSVIEANDGNAALRACHETKPDVVLLDIEMPGLDGHEVLRALKADPGLSDVPVVFLTGRTDTEDIVEGLRLGAHDYLKKPFEASELIARVSAAVRVKTLQDELRRRNAELDLISRTDALTGLSNRRHIEERLREFSSAAHRHDFSLGVLMFDIDHFKQVNDTAGHAAGDAVLREFAARLRFALREEDIPGRWGGEEFLVILPNTDLGGVRMVGQRVCDHIAANVFALPDHDPLVVTVSGGYAVSDGRDFEELVRRADTALYNAKARGRNRISTDDHTVEPQIRPLAPTP
jgi:two-component system cell cycle response regulator